VRLGSADLRQDTPPCAEAHARYWDRLHELAAVLDGVPWLLAGGLAIPVTLGRFYRDHFDIDIIFPLEAFEVVEERMRAGGFRLWTYFPYSLFGRARGALHIPVRAGGWLARRRMRKLKFRDASGRRKPPHLLSVIEALPYRIENGQYVTCDGRHRIPMAAPLRGHRYTTPAGHHIDCYHLSYVAYYKHLKTEPKHGEDLAVIDRFLRAEAPAAD